MTGISPVLLSKRRHFESPRHDAYTAPVYIVCSTSKLGTALDNKISNNAVNQVIN